MTNPVTFKYNNKNYTVDQDNQPGLWRQNAMTLYQFIFPHILLARELGISTFPNCDDCKELFYLIYTREEDWLRVDLSTGKNIVNILNNQI
jgi:hypothetical protein